MGATNRKDVLDAALTRPGRFDRAIEVMRPDFVGRLEGIKVRLGRKSAFGGGGVQGPRAAAWGTGWGQASSGCRCVRG